ncbi:Cell adhesion molecule 2 [Holothuria leucospilota]|uniref:Cell adhesion molecule 2 n=1 Tax=Holothuria leucospilota TaxID=206669 RepID=A0A9Q1BJI0_HOLLE|nr:Cell adhesion molecule 2 [Holothuria leucospilota]
MISLKRNLVLLILFSIDAKGDHHHHSEEILALVGRTAILNYTIGDTNSEFTITWILNDGRKMQHNPNRNFEKKEGKFKSVITNDKSVAELHIANVDFADAGKYDCSVVFYSAGRSLIYSWMLNAQGPPRIQMSPFLVENEPASSECCVQFAFAMEMSGIDIAWKMNIETLQTQTLVPGEEEISPVTMETLCSNITLNLHRQHHGHMLQCIILNSLNASAYVTLNVTNLEHVDVIVGSLYNPSDVVTVGKNENINITCLCHGYKIPKILLQRRNMGDIWINTTMKAYPVKQNITMTSQTFVYNSTDYGIFRCKAYNNIGLSAESKEFQIKEHGK